MNYMISLRIKGDPPNKQAASYKRNVNEIRKELLKNQSDYEIIDSPVSIEINIYTSKTRYDREGQDNLYIGDLDNLTSGILDELETKVFKNDSLVLELLTKKNVIESADDTYYTVQIKPLG